MFYDFTPGTKPPCQGAEFATLEYWVRLRVPMDQAIRLYRVSFPFYFKLMLFEHENLVLFITQPSAVCVVGSCALSTLGTGRV